MTTTETKTTELDYDECVALARQLGGEVVEVSEFTNLWPRRNSDVGDRRYSRKIAAMSRIDSSGKHWAVVVRG